MVSVPIPVYPLVIYDKAVPDWEPEPEMYFTADFLMQLNDRARYDPQVPFGFTMKFGPDSAIWYTTARATAKSPHGVQVRGEVFVHFDGWEDKDGGSRHKGHYVWRLLDDWHSEHLHTGLAVMKGRWPD